MPNQRRQPNRPVRAPLARYTNYFEVGHNPYEFLIDFGQLQPETSGVVLHTRIAVGPTHAKLLATMLRNAVSQYETDNGPIADATDTPDPLAAVLRSLPDFERRAVDARRDPVTEAAATPAKRSTQKR
jgi:hypothetical protein